MWYDLPDDTILVVHDRLTYSSSQEACLLHGGQGDMLAPSGVPQRAQGVCCRMLPNSLPDPRLEVGEQNVTAFSSSRLSFSVAITFGGMQLEAFPLAFPVDVYSEHS